MILPVATAQIRVADGISAVEHHIVAHIDPHMGHAGLVIGPFKEHQIAGPGIGRG